MILHGLKIALPDGLLLDPVIDVDILGPAPGIKKHLGDEGDDQHHAGDDHFRVLGFASALSFHGFDRLDDPNEIRFADTAYISWDKFGSFRSLA